MLMKLSVRRDSTVTNPLTWPSNKMSDGTENLATTGSVDGCTVLPEPQLDGNRQRVDTTRALFVGDFIPIWELPERGQSLTSNRL